MILVGHVTKDGQIAGPRVVEHMVDAVMSFDGDAGHHFRILRALKNRFGPTDEIGVFEMTGRGLAEVVNPSAFFLSGRDATAAGTSVFAGMEGTRPVLVEIQALVAPTSLGVPRRAVVGWDQNRLAMVLAVLETHAGVRLGQHDVYLNVAGGLKIIEPAADLAAAAALVSSVTGKILPTDAVYFGEIGLSGSVRPVVHGASRMKEAAKLGFEAAVAPAGGGSDDTAGLRVERVPHIADVVAQIAALPGGRHPEARRTAKAGDGRVRQTAAASDELPDVPLPQSSKAIALRFQIERKRCLGLRPRDDAVERLRYKARPAGWFTRRSSRPTVRGLDHAVLSRSGFAAHRRGVGAPVHGAGFHPRESWRSPPGPLPPFRPTTLHPLVMPYLEHYIVKDTIRMVAAIAIVFFATLVIVSIVTVKLSDAILDSRVGALDRTLGFLFGAARGFLLGVVAFMFFNWMVVPKSQPEWVANAKSRPLLQATGDEIVAMLPEDPEKLLRGLEKGAGLPQRRSAGRHRGAFTRRPILPPSQPGRRTEAAPAGVPPAGSAPTTTAQDDRQGLDTLCWARSTQYDVDEARPPKSREFAAAAAFIIPRILSIFKGWNAV